METVYRVGSGRKHDPLRNCRRHLAVPGWPRPPGKVRVVAIAGLLRGPSNVDATNTFGVSAGIFASFRVLSRRLIPRFCRSRAFLGRV